MRKQACQPWHSEHLWWVWFLRRLHAVRVDRPLPDWPNGLYSMFIILAMLFEDPSKVVLSRNIALRYVIDMVSPDAPCTVTCDLFKAIDHSNGVVYQDVGLCLPQSSKLIVQYAGQIASF